MSAWLWLGLGWAVHLLLLPWKFPSAPKFTTAWRSTLSAAFTTSVLPAVYRMYFLLPAFFEAISCLNLSTELLPCYFMSLFGCIPSFHLDEICTSAAHVEMKSKMPVFDNGIQLSPSHSKSGSYVTQPKSLRPLENPKAWAHLTIENTLKNQWRSWSDWYKQPGEVSDPYMCSWKYKANQEIKWKIQEVVIKNPQLNYHYNKPYPRGHLHSW